MIEYRLKKRKKGLTTPIGKDKRKLLSDRIPNVKPLRLKVGAFMFIGFALVGVALGTTISTYVFFGIMTLAGLIAIIESNKYIKYLAQKSNRLLDVLIFIGTLYSTISLGITITASLTVAGLGYTLVYAPWLRSKN